MSCEKSTSFMQTSILRDTSIGSLEKFAHQYLNHTISVLRKLNPSDIAASIQIIESVRLTGKQILIAGNGGSAATASHMANDFLAGPRWRPESALKVISLVDNTSVVTALANDHGYDHVFEKQIEALGSQGDCLIVISASGNSLNLVNAVTVARELGLTTIGFLGFDGGKLAEMVDCAVIAKTSIGDYGPAEDVHMVLDHLIGAALIKIRNFEAV